MEREDTIGDRQPSFIRIRTILARELLHPAWGWALGIALVIAGLLTLLFGYQLSFSDGVAFVAVLAPLPLVPAFAFLAGRDEATRATDVLMTAGVTRWTYGVVRLLFTLIVVIVAAALASLVAMAPAAMGMVAWSVVARGALVLVVFGVAASLVGLFIGTIVGPRDRLALSLGFLVPVIWVGTTLASASLGATRPGRPAWMGWLEDASPLTWGVDAVRGSTSALVFLSAFCAVALFAWGAATAVSRPRHSAGQRAWRSPTVAVVTLAALLLLGPASGSPVPDAPPTGGVVPEDEGPLDLTCNWFGADGRTSVIAPFGGDAMLLVSVSGAPANAVFRIDAPPQAESTELRVTFEEEGLPSTVRVNPSGRADVAFNASVDVAETSGRAASALVTLRFEGDAYHCSSGLVLQNVAPPYAGPALIAAGLLAAAPVVGIQVLNRRLNR